MSRQWGHWRLGRGDGGHYSEAQSLVRFRTFWGALSAGALSSTSTTQMPRITRVMAYSNSDAFMFPPRPVRVTSPPGSF